MLAQSIIKKPHSYRNFTPFSCRGNRWLIGSTQNIYNILYYTHCPIDQILFAERDTVYWLILMYVQYVMIDGWLVIIREKPVDEI